MRVVGVADALGGAWAELGAALAATAGMAGDDDVGVGFGRDLDTFAGAAWQAWRLSVIQVGAIAIGISATGGNHDLPGGPVPRRAGAVDRGERRTMNLPSQPVSRRTDGVNPRLLIYMSVDIDYAPFRFRPLDADGEVVEGDPKEFWELDKLAEHYELSAEILEQYEVCGRAQHETLKCVLSRNWYAEPEYVEFIEQVRELQRVMRAHLPEEVEFDFV